MWYIKSAAQVNTIFSKECVFFAKNAGLAMYFFAEVYLCRNSKPKLCFSVRGFCCALFCFLLPILSKKAL